MPFVDQLSLLFGLLLLQALADGCPAEVCICKWKGGKQTVECGGQSLPNIPEGMDPGTQVLNFSGNALQVLQSERFLRMDLLNLQKIYLSRNQLIRIHEKAFRGLTNLVELDLAENALQHIPSETFQDYSSLMRLSLSGNPIRELKSSAFRYLSFLTTLELSNCQIERIENEAFVGMDNLEWLRLDGNRISFIQGNYILPKSLHGISLQMNRWTCDCRLLDLHLWLTSYNTPQSEEPKCVEPPRLKGQIIKSLKRPQFACLPEVTPQSTYTEVSEGRNLSISCLVRAIPEPKVLWLFNGQVMTNDSLLDNLHLYYYIDESPGLAEEKRSEIFIYNVGVEDNGTFSCVGQNIAGTTFSNYTIRVIIKDPPVVNEVSFPQNYMNCIVASSAGGGLIFLVLLCTVIVKCKQREVVGKRKKCAASAVTSVNGTNTSSSDGSSSNDTGLMKCSSILNDGDSINANSGLILSACDGMTPTKLSKENGVILGNHMKQNIMLYAPLDGSNQTLQLSVNLTSAAATLASNSSNTPPPLLPPSLMINPAISNSLAYCSPPASLRNYVEKNPDLVNDAESGVKNKLKVSASLDASGSEYDAASDCSSVPVQYDQFYQLAPHFGSQIMRPNLTTAAAVANSHFAAMTTLPRGIQLKTVMNSLPPNPVDVHLNPVCFLGQDGFAFDYSNSHLQQSPGPMAPAHHHLIHQTSHQQPLTNIQQQQPHHQQQNFYRTLPHNKAHKQQQQQQQQQQQHFNGSPAATITTPNGIRYSVEAELLQQRTATSNYEKFAIPNIRCTAEGYPQQPQLVQYPSPPEGYKSISSPPRSNNDKTYVGLQQWPPCLPGYHAQGILYPSTLAATAPTAIYTTNNVQPQQQNATNTVASSAGGNDGGGDVDGDGGGGGGNDGSSGGAMHLQTVNLTMRSDLSAGLKVSPLTNQALPSETIMPPTIATAAVTQSIISTQNDGRKSVRCIAGQVDASTITPECKESDIAPTPNSGDAIRLATLPERSDLLPPATATEQSIKQRHLNGPLADSPDEGYVGDSHESTDM